MRTLTVCFVAVFATVNSLSPCDTSTPGPISLPSPPTFTTTPPGMPLKKINPAVIWGPIVGVAGAAAIGGTVAGVLASNHKKKEAVVPVIAGTDAPTIAPSVKFREVHDLEPNFREGDEPESSSSADLSESSSPSLPSGKSSSLDSGSGIAWIYIAGLLLLLLCCAALIAMFCKPKKRKGRGKVKRVAAVPAPMEVAPLLAPLPMMPMAAPTVETVTMPATYTMAPPMEYQSAPMMQYAAAQSAPMMQYAAGPVSYEYAAAQSAPMMQYAAAPVMDTRAFEMAAPYPYAAGPMAAPLSTPRVDYGGYAPMGYTGAVV